VITIRYHERSSVSGFINLMHTGQPVLSVLILYTELDVIGSPAIHLVTNSRRALTWSIDHISPLHLSQFATSLRNRRRTLVSMCEQNSTHQQERTGMILNHFLLIQLYFLIVKIRRAMLLSVFLFISVNGRSESDCNKVLQTVYVSHRQ
jgi:hypothetical protein